MTTSKEEPLTVEAPVGDFLPPTTAGSIGIEIPYAGLTAAKVSALMQKQVG